MATKKKAATKKAAKKVVPVEQRYRDSITGEFVTEDFAKENPDTTYLDSLQAWERGVHFPCLPNEQDVFEGQ